MSIKRSKMISVTTIEMAVGLLLWTLLDEQVSAAGIQAGWSLQIPKMRKQTLVPHTPIAIAMITALLFQIEAVRRTIKNEAAARAT